MLVATPGQTTSYLHNKKICHNSTTSSSKIHKANPPSAGKLPESSSRTVGVASTFMKTLSVRLNRGNEYLKNAVQRALNSTSAVETSKTKIASALLSPIPPKQSKSSVFVSKSKPNTVPPTIFHRHPDRHLSINSTDSICGEMCHFKPIRAAPLTSWKSGSKSRGSSFKIPKPVMAKKIIQSVVCEDDSEDNIKYYMLRPTPLVSIQFSPSSAFVCLDAQMKYNNSNSRMKFNTQDDIDDGYSVQKKRVGKRSSNSQHNSRSFKGKTSNKSKNIDKKSIMKENRSSLIVKRRPVRQSALKMDNVSPVVRKVTYNKRTTKVNEEKAFVINSRKRKTDTVNNSSATKQRCLRSGKGSDKTENEVTSTQQRKRKPQEKHIVRGCSPPLTRSRLKQKTNQKLNGALTFEGRPI